LSRVASRILVVSLASASAAAAIAVASGGASTKPRAIPFKTLWRTSGEGTGRLPFTTGKALTAAAVVWARNGDAAVTGTTFVSSAHLAELDRFAWAERFVLVAAIVRPTTGFSVRVKRISYQHPAADVEQFCVVASVSKPRRGQPVEQRRTVSAHVVTIARRGFGLSFSRAAILRSSNGELLATTTSFGPVRPGACRG
jgi:hypothetical protein